MNVVVMALLYVRVCPRFAPHCSVCIAALIAGGGEGRRGSWASSLRLMLARTTRTTLTPPHARLNNPPTKHAPQNALYTPHAAPCDALRRRS